MLPIVGDAGDGDSGGGCGVMSPQVESAREWHSSAAGGRAGGGGSGTGVPGVLGTIAGDERGTVTASAAGLRGVTGSEGIDSRVVMPPPGDPTAPEALVAGSDLVNRGTGLPSGAATSTPRLNSSRANHPRHSADPPTKTGGVAAASNDVRRPAGRLPNASHWIEGGKSRGGAFAFGNGLTGAPDAINSTEALGGAPRKASGDA